MSPAWGRKLPAERTACVLPRARAWQSFCSAGGWPPPGKGGDLIYVISEPDQPALLPEGALRVLVTAGIDTVKTRFAAREGREPARARGSHAGAQARPL